MSAPDLILACSGPGASDAIRLAMNIGYFCAALGVVIIVALAFVASKADRLPRGRRERVRQKLRFTTPSAILMLLIHPAGTVSATHGDCGMLKVQASLFFTAVYIGLLIFQCRTFHRTS